MSVRSNASTKRTNKQDVEQLLSDLDSLAVDPVKKSSSSAAAASSAAPPSDAQSLLDDLDNLVSDKHRRITPKPEAQQQQQQQEQQQKPSASSSEARNAEGSSTSSLASESAGAAQSDVSSGQSARDSATTDSGGGAGGGWGGWGSVWTSATRLADQARAELEKRTSEVAGAGAGDKEATSAVPTEGSAGAPQVQQIQAEIAKRGWALAQGFRSIVAEGGLEKLGGDLTAASRRHLTDIMNAVAPPISAHEVLQVTLSHDLVGYDGVSEVVFRVLAAAMETHQPQVSLDGEGSTEQQLVVNKAPDRESRGSRPKEAEKGQERSLNAVEGFQEAYKLAEANLEELVKAHDAQGSTSPSKSANTANSVTIPVTTCPLFLRIQPCLAPPPWAARSASPSEGNDEQQLYFLLLLRDPSHQLSHSTISQALPAKWMDIPFDSNAWVEQALVDVLQGALSTVGQAYVLERKAKRLETETKKETTVEKQGAETA